MRLGGLRIDSLPGLERPLTIERLSPGVNVVLGPNASGKSSLIRAMLALLYPDDSPADLVDAEARLIDANGVEHVVRRLGKSVTWERDGKPSAAPALPPPHLVGTYVLRLEDLLGPNEAGPKGRKGQARNASTTDRLDVHIAQRLDKELTGGIDLKSVRRSLGSQAEKGQRLAGALRDAAAAHAELRRERAELQREEARLVGVRLELVEAEEQATRHRLIDDALALLEVAIDTSSLRAELASFPAQLGALLGNEATELAKALSAKAQLQADLKRIDELTSLTRERLEDIGLPPSPSVASAELNLDLAEALISVHDKLSHKTREQAALQARYAQAVRRLGGSPTSPVEMRLDEAVIENVERLLEQRQGALAELRELRRQLEEASRLVEPTDGDDQLLDVAAGVYRGGRVLDGMSSPLRTIRHDLVRWLREPAAEPRRPDWSWGLALGLTVLTVAASGLQVPSGWLALLAGLTAAWVAVTWLVLGPAGSPAKARIEQDVASLQDTTDITLPVDWEPGAVVDLILDIDDEIARREASKREHDRQDERLRQLTGDSQLAQRRVTELESQLEAIRDQCGFGVPAGIGLGLWLQAARETETTSALLAACKVERDALLAEAATLERRLRAYLDSVGASHLPGGDGARFDPQAVRSSCRQLVSKTRARDTALAEQAQLERERERVSEGGVKVDASIDVLLDRAGIGRAAVARDPAAAQLALNELIANLPAWRSVKENLRTKEALLDDLRSRVEVDEQLLDAAVNGDRGFLEAAAASAERAAQRATDLSRDIHRTERDVEIAGSERKLQQTAAKVRAATDELAAHRHRAFELASAEFLLDAIEAEHQAGGRPAALQRAADWFNGFTEGAFELTFEPSAVARGGRELGARDAATGRSLDLDELSTGTRAQLLLASRLAFAIESEAASASLPFFLDEALTTSDEQRFKQVAGAIMSVARNDSRQFIYLSARSDDADLWRRAALEHGDEIELIEALNQAV